MGHIALKVGDRIAPTARRGVQVGTTTPRWYVLECLSGQEARTVADLKGDGASDAWFPVTTTTRKIMAGPRKGETVKRTHAAVCGYVLLHCTGFPQWDVILGQKTVYGVIGGLRPLVVSEAQIMQMAQVPERLTEIVAAEIEARTIRVGDLVEIISGALAASQFTVLALDGAHVRGEIAGFGKMSVRAAFVAKVAAG